VTLALAGATLGVLALFAGAFGAVVWYAQSGTAADVSEGSFLYVRLEGSVSDAPQVGGLFVDPEDAPATATEIAAAIRKASTDARIAGVYLRMTAPEMGWGLAREIRTALVDLRAAGKPCVTYAEVYGMRDYYLASACDKVVLAPAGVPLVTGQSLSVTYYRDALAWLGIQPRFVHVGDYKTAIEPFERMEPSPAAVESYEYLLDGLWEVARTEIATSRNMTVEQVQAVIDNPSLTARRAVESGLFDAAAYEDAVVAHLPKVNEPGWKDLLAGEPVVETEDTVKERFTALSEYRKDLDDGPADARIAVIYAEGTMLPGKSGGGLFADSGLFDGDFREWMRAAREDESVKAIVVRVNSPGGSALAADMMRREVALAQKAGKPVVVSMADYAASGGYWLSAGTDWIVAQPTTITGSIGVFGQFFDARGTYQKLLLAEHVYKRGERADLLSVTSEHDESDRQVLQAFVDDTYSDFVKLVADGRKMSVERAESVAQGRVWTGTQALGERGLVDELGGLDVALVKARALAGSPDAGVVRWPEQKGFIDLLVEEMAQAESPSVAVDLPIPGAEAALRELEVMSRIQAAGGAAAWLPGSPTLR
jgi:protease-4